MARTKAGVRATTRTSSYNEDSIKHYKGLDGIRMRPGMYLGERGDHMVFRGAKELVDNGSDEFLAGRNKKVELYVDPKHQFYIVADAAQGIPVGMHKEAKVPTVTLIFTELHAGGKFDNKAYETSAGVHGIGAAATNAVSATFEFWTKREGVWYHQTFAKGKITSKLEKQNPPKSVTSLLQATGKQGTIIKFVPDQSIVSVDGGKTKAKLDTKYCVSWLKNIAMMNPGLEVTMTMGSKTKTWVNKEGLISIVKARLVKEDLAPMGKPATLESKSLSFAVCWSSYADDDGLQAYVSNSFTRDGGSHVDEFWAAVVKALLPYKNKRDKYAPRDVRYGLVGVMNWKMHNPEFSSQVKDRLTSNLKQALYNEALKFFTEFFSKNKALAKKIIKRAADSKKAKEEIRKIMESVSEINSNKRGALLPTQLAAAKKCSPDKREIYIVEGDSAGGIAKKARDTSFQEVLCLTGKPANGVRLSQADLLKSKPVQTLLAALGYNHKVNEPHKALRVNKIMLLSDADPDGPLEGSTPVILSDGSTATLEILYQVNRQFKVWGRIDEQFQQVKVPQVVHAGRHYVYQELKLADGTVLRCSLDHKWMLKDEFIKKVPKEFVIPHYGHKFIEARNIAAGTELCCMTKQHAGFDDLSVVSNTRIYSPAGIDMYCLTVPEAGNFLVQSRSGKGICSSNCHINSLLLGIIFRMMPKLLDEGRVYICNAPLFSSFYKGQLYVGRTHAECLSQMPKGTPGEAITRAKGWGELAPETLAVLAFNPDTRNLIQVQPMDKEETTFFKSILGSDSAARKELLGID